MCISLSLYIYIYMYICMCVYIYIYIHTYIHAPGNPTPEGRESAGPGVEGGGMADHESELSQQTLGF